jgi:hypothetical protein
MAAACANRPTADGLLVYHVTGFPTEGFLMDATHVDAALASFTALIVEAAGSTDAKQFRSIA